MSKGRSEGWASASLRRLVGVLLLPFGLAVGAAAQKPVSLADVGVSLSLPAGFSQWSEERIRTKYPAARPPKYVYAPDARGRVSIAVTSSAIPLKDDELPKLKQFLESTFHRMPGIKWVKREFLELNGSRWVHLEFETKAIDTTIHNDTYSILRKGQFVGVNYNCITSLWAKNKAALAKSRASIKVLP